VASDTELSAMRRAIAISTAALGTTNPNPTVGAVILDQSGTTVGEGVTQPVGGDHAEVVALRAGADRARGGTLVVTLEPCRHVGRTGSCSAAILAAGITRVVYALGDPHDPASGGADQLRTAEVEVEAGLLADEAAAVLGPWTLALGRGRPHVSWKYAATLDGRTAASDNTSRWITGDEARIDVHRERYLSDAVIVGIGTVLADDPQLAVRDWPARRQPTRVVVDSDARTPLTSRVLDDVAPTLVVVAEGADATRVTALEEAGADVVALPRSGAGVDLAALLAALHDREIYLGLLEGGATLAAAFVRAGFVDRVVGYYAPTLLGAGVPLLTDLGIATMADAMRLKLDDVARIGDDVRIVAQVMTGSV
jgi:diaminohydroxyphosphoribosylaminopyrimidine deaminase / 5-amino-6-(5-phosphoribosylamino)uracil reductase